ncbi:MAG: hypothetical protein KDB79_02270, partial [Acidobacteria bacterium]|nr:hypothetical protein [Acidobacteriota bacterium]
KIGFRKSTASSLELVSQKRSIDNEVMTEPLTDDAKPIKAFINEADTRDDWSSGEAINKKGVKKTVINEPRAERADKKKEETIPRIDAGDISASIIAKKR